ncbi:uncharacterized protein LOC129578028 [Sitodiplosis mosellana]|uniref:uncharacterized protein LOC129578028 n=1 Tax=Sitodiplosis mosellana TaxID=263140 RepID=UPI002444D25E|nr:uncharacterized protein LOC129578028 [Sitodiplosis mosellana]
MALNSKFIFSCIAVTMILVTFFSNDTLASGSKIRIHVPVKHHTHFHTKTIVKTVHIPVKVKSNHHHHHLIQDEISWAKSYPKKKKIRPVFY